MCPIFIVGYQETYRCTSFDLLRSNRSNAITADRWICHTQLWSLSSHHFSPPIDTNSESGILCFSIITCFVFYVPASPLHIKKQNMMLSTGPIKAINSWRIPIFVTRQCFPNLICRERCLCRAYFIFILFAEFQRVEQKQTIAMIRFFVVLMRLKLCGKVIRFSSANQSLIISK